MLANRYIPLDVRAAITAFLNQCQNEARPFATTEALGALRTIFPDLDVSDGDLEDAIFSEAATAGFDLDHDSRNGSDKMKRKALQRWENEGSATGKVPRTEARRLIDSDTAGARRRARPRRTEIS